MVGGLKVQKGYEYVVTASKQLTILYSVSEKIALPIRSFGTKDLIVFNYIASVQRLHHSKSKRMNSVKLS